MEENKNQQQHSDAATHSEHHHSDHHHSDHHHSHHHHHRSESERSSSKKREEDIKKNRDKKKISSRIKRFLPTGWVAVLLIVVVGLVAWNAELHGQLVAVRQRAEDNSGNYNYSDNATAASYSVPDYWKDEVEDVTKEVQKLMDEAGRDALAFAWFSDTHYEGANEINAQTGNLTAAVMDQCGIDYAVLTGDVMTQGIQNSEQEVRRCYENVYKMLAPIGNDRLLQVKGNHDGSWGGEDKNKNEIWEAGETYFYNMTEEQMFNIMFRRYTKNEKFVFDDTGDWYYVDDPFTKTRFVMLNVVWRMDENNADGTVKYNRMGYYGLGQDQLSWLANEALHFEEDGWAVVLAGHVPYTDPQIRDTEVLQGILNAYESKGKYAGTYGDKGTWQYVNVSVDYSKKHTADLIGYFHGHIHRDRIDSSSAATMISITANNNIPYDKKEEPREKGTDNELAIDFVVVNRKTGKVNTVRLGVGENREFTY